MPYFTRHRYFLYLISYFAIGFHEFQCSPPYDIDQASESRAMPPAMAHSDNADIHIRHFRDIDATTFTALPASSDFISAEISISVPLFRS